MRRTLVPGGPGGVGRHVLVLFLSAGRNVRQMLDIRDLRPGARVSLIAAHRDLEPFDAIAGCEYVDDRIRLRE